MACERFFASSSPDNSSPAKSKRLPNTWSHRSIKAATNAAMSARAISWMTRLGGIGNGRIDQMPDASILRSFRGNDSLTGLFLGPGLGAVAHQKHGADATCCLQNRRCVTEIASHEIGTRRHQLPRGVAIRLAGERSDAM